MNKIQYLAIILVVFFLSGCFGLMDDSGEVHPELEDWLSIINTDSTGFHKIVEVSYNNHRDRLKVHNFKVTPDESYFIVNSGIHGIWRLCINGNDPTKLSDTLWVRQTELAISNDGEMIAFVSRGDIYRVNVDGSDLIRLTNTLEDYEDHPNFYPNNEEIVYSKIVDLADSSQYHSICKMNINGNNQTEILSNISRTEQLFTYPIILPNSNLILFNSFGENPSINTHDTSNGESSIIFTGDISDKRLSVSSVCSEIIANDYNNIYIIDYSGLVLIDIRELTNKSFDDAVFSPDGSFIALTDYNELYEYNFGNSTLRFLQNGVLPYCFNNCIYFIWDLD